MYSEIGRPSVPPDASCAKATLLMAEHTVRSERLFYERNQVTTCSFGGFLYGLSMVDGPFDHSTLSFSH